MVRKTAPKKPPAYVPCTIKELPEPERVEAARFAVRENPANAPPPHGLAMLDLAEPSRAAILTGSYWGPGGVDLSVQFLDTPDAATRRMILSDEIGMNTWGRYANVRFRETAAEGDVRISRAGSGYWSYLGTGIRFVRRGEPTMNLQGFTSRTIVSEYERVVEHETGHTLGLPHEQQLAQIVNNIDPDKAIPYFRRTQGWSEAVVRAQVLTPLEPGSYRMTAGADVNGIMCYSLPGTIMRDGVTVPGGKKIDAIDAAFIATQYPGPAVRPPEPPRYPGDVYVDDERGILWWWPNPTGPERPLVQPFPGVKVRIEADASRSLVVAACGAGGPPRAVGYDYRTGNKVFDLNPVPHFPAAHRGGVFPSIRPEGGQVSFSGYGRWVVEVNPDGGSEVGAEERNPDAPAGSVLRRLIV